MGEKKELADQRYKNLQEIQDQGHDPYPHRYEQTHTVAELVAAYAGKSSDELQAETVEVQTAGRLVNIRGHGKAGFGDLFGSGGRIQVYFRKDRMGDDCHQLFQLLDLGDFVGVTGSLGRTRTNELTIFADSFTFLAKGLLPLPEKWHGLSDVETRYRQRYLDLIANQEVREVFLCRSRIISEVRGFLDSRGYLEVETPMMQTLPGGAVAKPFETFHEALGIPLFLRIAPELYLKRLVVGGFDRVFEINRSFRNEGISTQHNPEFTMVEFYQAYSDYRDLMELTEEMLRQVVVNVTGEPTVEYAGAVIDFGNFGRFSMLEAVREFWKLEKVPSEDELSDPDQLARLCRELEVAVEPSASWGKMLAAIFEAVVEGQLVQPTLVYDFPAELSPLSKLKDDDPRFAERFELFVAGFEVANAYSELNDPEEQEKRFRQQADERRLGDDEAHRMDKDYLRALRYGMPPTAGEGIGIDRLTMVLTGAQSIREVILFPHLRPESSGT